MDKDKKKSMQGLYRHAQYPANNKDLISKTNAAALSVYEKLTSAGVDGPPMDKYYRKRYYVRHLDGLRSKLRNCAHHVMWAIAISQKKSSEVALVDHGGGLGLISLLAKEMGVGRVIYNDIDVKFAEAAQGIANMAGVPADQYVVGDVDSFVETLGDDDIDTLVSYDVLEHIYDLDNFFATLCNSPCCPRTLFMSSGANMFNARWVHGAISLQRRQELLYRCSRIAIIRGCAPDLQDDQIVLLCKKTRMLVRSEIESVTKRYLENGKVELPNKIGANAYDPFRTNTVDPETGWWVEHILNPFYVSSQLRKYGFTANTKPGYYGGKGAFLNPVIRIAGLAAMPIAPFYTVTAVRKVSTRAPERVL